MKMNLAHALLAVAFAIGHGTAIAGGSVNVFTQGGAGGVPPPNDGWTDSKTGTSSGLATVTKSASGTAAGFPYGGGAVTAGALETAAAQDGLLRAYSSDSVSVSTFPVNTSGYNSANSQGHATASWNDLLSLSAPGHALHEAVTIHGDVVVTGSMSGTPDSSDGGSVVAFRVDGIGIGAGPNSFFTVDIACSNCWGQVLTNGVAPDAQQVFSVIPITINTTLNTAILMQYSIDTMSRVGALVPFHGPNTGVTGIANYSDTFAWGGITSVTDSTGALLTGLTLQSRDGFDYFANLAAPIPEPGTYAMMLAGLGALGFMARRRKQQGA